ncbi:helix-turn-helix domain-containing protein [Halovenus rubra]|uniref:Helix-turn-helix domain-containing protein n=2 Tax=Halovenus rubra TaxID=869890 RepID=A0ACC7E4R3_9EURY|nr:helix-turn-helix domain-containing protein [Halovenus rubra]
MRYATIRLHPKETFHPVLRKLARAPDIRRRAIHSVKLLDDGTITLLAKLDGRVDTYREIMEETPEVLTYAATDSGHCYSQVEPTDDIRRILERRNEGDFIIKMPMEYTDDGWLQATIIGEEKALQEVPEKLGWMEMELISTGPYTPETTEVFADLTDRQREVLETALELGYYETPREATLKDIAAELGVDHGTAGNHIQRIESKVFSKYVL